MHYYSIALFVVIHYANYRFYRYIEYKLDLYILLANTLSNAYSIMNSLSV